MKLITILDAEQNSVTGEKYASNARQTTHKLSAQLEGASDDAFSVVMHDFGIRVNDVPFYEELVAPDARAMALMLDKVVGDETRPPGMGFLVQDIYVPGLGLHIHAHKTSSFHCLVLVIDQAQDDVWVAYEGSRGRFKEELRLLTSGTTSSFEKVVGPDHFLYESTGPEDMKPWEDRASYSIRTSEHGRMNSLNDFVRRYVYDEYISDTDKVIMEWLALRDAEFAEQVEEMRGSEQNIRYQTKN